MTANEALDAHMKSLPYGERSAMVAKMIINLEISGGTITNWRKGKGRIKPVYRREINQIVGKDIFADVTD